MKPPADKSAWRTRLWARLRARGGTDCRLREQPCTSTAAELRHVAGELLADANGVGTFAGTFVGTFVGTCRSWTAAMCDAQGNRPTGRGNCKVGWGNRWMVRGNRTSCSRTSGVPFGATLRATLGATVTPTPDRVEVTG